MVELKKPKPHDPELLKSSLIGKDAEPLARFSKLCKKKPESMFSFESMDKGESLFSR